MTQGAQAAVIMVAASGFFAVTSAFVKLGAQHFHLSELVFYRSFVGLLFLLPALSRGGIRLGTARPWAHLTRGAMGVVSMGMYFYAVVHLPLGTAVTLQYTSPIFIALLSLLYLRERINLRLALGLLLGFVGVVLVMRPAGLGGPLLAGAVGLGSGLAAGIALFSVKLLSKTEPVGRIVFYFSLLSSAISGVWAAVDGFSPLTWESLPLLLGMGIPATLGQLLITRAYQMAPASQMSALSYSTVGFAALLGLALWHVHPDLLGWLGLGVLVLAGLLAATATPAPARAA
ncbi:MAG: DMT family transporter [Pseudomonadota bacterium]